MEMNPFTLIATCRHKSDCPAELLPRFSLAINLQPYIRLELQQIAERLGQKIGVLLDPKAAEIVAGCSTGNPRLYRSTGKNILSQEDVLQALAAFGIHVDSGADAHGPSRVTDLSPRDFEQMMAALLTRMGFVAETTKLSGDGGIDVVAALEKPIVGGRYLFQCKRYARENLVGAPTIRDFYGAVTADRAVKGIFITTSDFTPQAREFAERTNIELIDLTRLRKLLLEAGLPDIDHT